MSLEPLGDPSRDLVVEWERFSGESSLRGVMLKCVAGRRQMREFRSAGCILIDEAHHEFEIVAAHDPMRSTGCDAHLTAKPSNGVQCAALCRRRAKPSPRRDVHPEGVMAGNSFVFPAQLCHSGALLRSRVPGLSIESAAQRNFAAAVELFLKDSGR
jgi:hypothetical protein